jgi:hypothetical protein
MGVCEGCCVVLCVEGFEWCPIPEMPEGMVGCDVGSLANNINNITRHEKKIAKQNKTKNTTPRDST